MPAPIFRLTELRDATGGHWLVPPATDAPVGAASDTAAVSGVYTDSRRSPGPGACFLALRGDRFDGHAYVVQAVEAGAAAVVVQDLDAAALEACRAHGVGALAVADTLVAYGDLASAHRQRFGGTPVVAVTGSSGKTSTKEILAAILRLHFEGQVLVTEGNTNNLVGVPQNLLRLDSSHRVAVLELGTNAPGEIGRLSQISRPQHAIITNVGPVHLEGLGSVDGVADEKSDIFLWLDAGSDSLAVLPTALLGHPRVQPKLPVGRTVGVGVDAGSAVQVLWQGGDAARSRFTVRFAADGATCDVDWPLGGRHQALNAASAMVVARQLGVPLATMQAALVDLHLPGMRMRTELRDGVTWINDAYNANPDSMRALVDVLATRRPAAPATLYLALGDMLELGPDEDRFHAETLAYARDTLPGVTLMPVGERMQRAATALGIPGWPEVATARQWLAPRLQTGDVVALKASRGMALERLADDAAAH